MLHVHLPTQLDHSTKSCSNDFCKDTRSPGMSDYQRVARCSSPNGQCLRKVVLITSSHGSTALSRSGAGSASCSCAESACPPGSCKMGGGVSRTLEKMTQQVAQSWIIPVLPSAPCSLPIFKVKEPNCSPFHFPLLRRNL